MQKIRLRKLEFLTYIRTSYKDGKKKYNKNMSYSLNFLKTKSKAEIFLDLLVALSYCGSAGIIFGSLKNLLLKLVTSFL